VRNEKSNALVVASLHVNSETGGDFVKQRVHIRRVQRRCLKEVIERVGIAETLPNTFGNFSLVALIYFVA
jgi:hypothetical protein